MINFRLFIRHIRRKPGFALINVGGLGLATAVCLLIGTYATSQLRYDAGFPDATRRSDDPRVC